MNRLFHRFLAAAILCVLLAGPAKVPVQAAQLRNPDSAVGADLQILQTGHLVKNGNSIRYKRSNGKYLKKGWRTVHGKKYYFGANTYAVKGLKKINGRYYIFSSSGVLRKGWIKYKKHWYYASTSTGRLKTGWKTIKGKKYYFSYKKLYRLTGFQKIGKKYYYFNKAGVMQTKKQKVGKTWVRFNKDGSVYKPSAAVKGKQVARFALKFVGNPYVWGGASLTKGADCSGFVMAVYQNFGISLPHYDASIRQKGKAVGPLSKAIPGDVICYNGHVAIYLGNNKIVHAANSRQGICVGNNAAYDWILSIRRFF